jgi:hypothetical protein
MDLSGGLSLPGSGNCLSTEKLPSMIAPLRYSREARKNHTRIYKTALTLPIALDTMGHVERREYGEIVEHCEKDELCRQS